MSHGSQQLRIFRRAIREGATLEEACEATGPGGINLDEGRIHLARDQRNPPPPEAYDLIEAPAAKEPAMAAAAKQNEPDNGGEYKRPDAAKAFDVYDKQIKPKLTKIDTARGECSQPWQDIKEHAHFPRQVMNFIIALENIDDDAKRDHFLLALSSGLQERQLFLPRDLVTMANGEDGGNVIPMGERQRPQLATLAGDPNLPMGVPSDGSETDLADAAGEDEPFEEASEEELAGQAQRPSNQRKRAAAEADAENAALSEAAE